jgi:protein-ribulosamine 3-kinase
VTPGRSLPDGVRRGVEDRLGARIVAVSPLGGGCVSPAARIDGSNGRSAFVKWMERAPPGLFLEEAEGLRHLALSAGDALRIPEVLGVGEEEGDAGWLLLEFVPRGEGAAADSLPFGVALGRGLAALHAPLPDVGCGWDSDNWIGPLPQRNTPHPSWPDFWREERILPQLQRAREGGYFRGRDGDEWNALLGRLDDLLEGAADDGVSLLHGDLWSGNVYEAEGGEPVLIDPAVYRGHREVDLAMAELFGGFPPDFLPAYREAWPLEPEYGRMRRDVYQLYPLLVHVNLFGGGYAASASGKVRRLLAV